MESLAVVANGKSSAVSPPRRGFFIAQVVLRLLTIAFMAAAVAVMVNAKQTVEIFTLPITVRYSNLSAFKFLVAANAVICGFSLLSLIFISISHKGKKSDHSFLVYLHDLVMMVLSMSACAAAIAIGYVGQYGQEKATWYSVCENVKMFCNNALASIVLSIFGFLCLFILTIMAALNLKSL